MDSIKELFYQNKYDEAIILIKQKLQEDSSNSDLWYCLFLAENGDYFTTDFESGYSNELSFNKALENASRRKSAEYISEYNFYKKITTCNNLNKLFRYAQYGNINGVYNLFSSVDINKLNINENQLNDFYDDLDFISYTSEGDNELDLAILLVNLIYLKINTKEILAILNTLINRGIKSKTYLSPYEVLNNVSDIKSKLDKLYDECHEEIAIEPAIEEIKEEITEVIDLNDFEIDQYGTLLKYTGSEVDIVIPNNVNKIGEKVFYNKKIKSVILPPNLIEIGRSAFSFNPDLNKIIFPYNLRKIEYCSFSNCGIKELYIPKLLTEISSSAFENCPVIKIEVDINNKVYCSRNNCNAIENRDKKSIILGCSKTKINSDIVKIETSAFARCKELTNIYLPPSVKEIGVCAFSNCINLNNINLSNIKVFGSYAFLKTAIRNIDLSNAEIIGDTAFASCNQLEYVEIPKTVKEVGKSPFESCEKINNIKIYNEDYIGRFSVHSFDKHMSISINDSLKNKWIYTKIHILPSIRTIQCGGSKISSNTFFRAIYIETVELLEGVMTISEEAFAKCNSLQKIVIPKSIIEIKKNSFLECPKLNKIVFNGTKKEWKKVSIVAKETKKKIEKILVFTN